MTYKLTLVKIANGEYQLSHYPKAVPETHHTLSMALNRMVEMYESAKLPANFWRQEPTLVNLPPDDEKLTRWVIQSLVSMDNLEKRVGTPAGFPFDHPD